MSLALINGALIAGYQAAGLGLSTAYEGRDFTPTPGTSWAACFNLRADSLPDSMGISGQDRHNGVFQVDINAPLNVGTATLLASAQTLRAYFYAGRALATGGQSVHVTACSVSSIRNSEGWLRISVSITYRAYTARP